MHCSTRPPGSEPENTAPDVAVLVVSDLTRLEGFLRSSEPAEVGDALARDVIRRLLDALAAGVVRSDS